MLAEQFRARALPSVERPRPSRDAAYAARRRLQALRDALIASLPHPKRRDAGEPPVFFFDRTRQAELEAAREFPTNDADSLMERIGAEVAALCESVEVRQMARAIPGLLDVVRRGERLLPTARAALGGLAALLAMPDDEIVLALRPQERWGCRILVRGIDAMNPFQVLMLDAVGRDEGGGAPRLPGRFASACRAADPVIPAGVPMVVDLPYQLLRPEALRADGTVPSGFAACDHWLWGWESLAAAPRLDGELVVLLGDPAFPLMWEVERRFPAMAAEATVTEILNPFQVIEVLSRLTGQSIPLHASPSSRQEPPFAKAA